jgi:predicted flap endonuclease-1-like 5' DNA nuclease
MRTIYLVIVLFLVWCLLSAQWYLFWVKGLDPKPENIDPHESALAIAEILFMILISVLIGFALAWMLRQRTIRMKDRDIVALLEEQAAQQASSQLYQEQIEKVETTLSKARDTFRQDFLTISRDNERLKTELEEVKKELHEKLESINQLRGDLSIAESELKQIERTRSKEQDKDKKQVPKESDPEAKRALKIAAQEKDDLKVINGIGPGIEKRLNEIGIHSYRQISEFTPVLIEQISSSIKFFPGRIERDRWVEQASKLYLDKIRK